VTTTRVVRRLPPAPEERQHGGSTSALAFGRGLQIAIDVDEMAFEGGSAFVLGSVLEQYFARYVSLNSFTETVLRSTRRGDIHRWQPHWGTRPTL
jgi:type VI secretion system protein ImpG